MLRTCEKQGLSLTQNRWKYQLAGTSFVSIVHMGELHADVVGVLEPLELKGSYKVAV